MIGRMTDRVVFRKLRVTGEQRQSIMKIIKKGKQKRKIKKTTFCVEGREREGKSLKMSVK